MIINFLLRREFSNVLSQKMSTNFEPSQFHHIFVQMWSTIKKQVCLKINTLWEKCTTFHFITLWWNCDENVIYTFYSHYIFMTFLSQYSENVICLHCQTKIYLTNSWHFYHNVREMYCMMSNWMSIEICSSSNPCNSHQNVMKMWFRREKKKKLK